MLVFGIEGFRERRVGFRFGFREFFVGRIRGSVVGLILFVFVSGRCGELWIFFRCCGKG